MTREQAQKLTERILSFSKFPECTVNISDSEHAFLRFANNGITTSGIARERTISIASTRENRTGVAETTEMDDASLRAVVARSEEIAAIAPPDPERMPPLGAQEFPDAHAFDEQTARARQPEMLPHAKTVIEQAAAKKFTAAGFIERRTEYSVVANKAGLFGYTPLTDARMSTTIRAADGSSSGWAAQPAAHFGEINSGALAAQAIGKCAAWTKPIRPEMGEYTVILEPTAVGDLVRFLAQAFDARTTDEGRTFLSKPGGGTLVGERLFPEFITLRSDPLSGRIPVESWTQALLPARPQTWIEKGVVKKLSYSRYWAEKTKNEPTPGPTALVLDGFDMSMDELIRSTKRGLLITHFWYIRMVNPRTLQVTGLTRDGVFLVEDGKITTPVTNLRFNESPVRMLQNAVKLSRPVRVRGLEGGSMIAPGLVADRFTFTSISEAV